VSGVSASFLFLSSKQKREMSQVGSEFAAGDGDDDTFSNAGDQLDLNAINSGC
jgi:hypothetical protein